MHASCCNMKRERKKGTRARINTHIHAQTHSTGALVPSIILPSLAVGGSHHVEQLLKTPADQIITCLIWPAGCFVVYQHAEVNKSLENNLSPHSSDMSFTIMPSEMYPRRKHLFCESGKMFPNCTIQMTNVQLVWLILQVTLAGEGLFSGS